MLTVFKQIFTWWNQQTFGTRLQIFFSGKLVGEDKNGNKRSKIFCTADNVHFLKSKNTEVEKKQGVTHEDMEEDPDEVPF